MSIYIFLSALSCYIDPAQKKHTNSVVIFVFGFVLTFEIIYCARATINLLSVYTH